MWRGVHVPRLLLWWGVDMPGLLLVPLPLALPSLLLPTPPPLLLRCPIRAALLLPAGQPSCGAAPRASIVAGLDLLRGGGDAR